jgi:hypothetical protein
MRQRRLVHVLGSRERSPRPGAEGTGFSLYTIRSADTIIVRHNVVVAEQGTHDDLLARGGIYAGLCWANPATPAEPPASPRAWLGGTDPSWRAR